MNTAFRSKLVDEPIVEMILSQKFKNSKIKFNRLTNNSNYSLTASVNGTVKTIIVVRNSSKYFKSPNFLMSLNKNSLSQFNNSIFAFIDEVSNSLYMVDSVNLLMYIIKNSDNLKQSSKDNIAWIVIPKKDIVSLVADDGIIKYSNNVAELFSNNRDESKYSNLF